MAITLTKHVGADPQKFSSRWTERLLGVQTAPPYTKGRSFYSIAITMLASGRSTSRTASNDRAVHSLGRRLGPLGSRLR